MNQTYFRILYRHNYWARDRILDTVAQLPAAKLTEPYLPHQQTIMSTLTHMLNAETLWRQRLQYPKQQATWAYTNPIADLETLRPIWEDESGKMLRLLDTMPSSWIEKTLRYQSTEGDFFQNSVWSILLQIITHGAAHRAELALTLTQLGYSPGDLDLVLYLRESA